MTKAKKAPARDSGPQSGSPSVDGPTGRKKKREAIPKATKVSLASVDAPPAPHSGIRGKPNNGSKNPGGRPPEWTDSRIESLGESLIRWSIDPKARYLESFCAENETYPQRLSEFAGKNEKFAEALKRAKSACAAHLAKATADGDIPTAFGIFGLKQHGWNDRQQVEHTGKVEQSHSGNLAVTINTAAVADLLNGPSPK